MCPKKGGSRFLHSIEWCIFANSVCPLHGFQFNSKRIAKVGAASATGRKEAPIHESCSDRCIAKVGAASAEGRKEAPIHESCSDRCIAKVGAASAEGRKEALTKSGSTSIKAKHSKKHIARGSNVLFYLIQLDMIK